jgi:hypothetical protein
VDRDFFFSLDAWDPPIFSSDASIDFAVRTLVFISLFHYFYGQSTTKLRWSRVELGCCGDLSSAPLAFALVVSKEEDRRWFFA